MDKFRFGKEKSRLTGTHCWKGRSNLDPFINLLTSLTNIFKSFHLTLAPSRLEDENHPTVKPDGYVDNLADAVDLILKYN